MGAPDIKKPNNRGDHNFVIKVKIPKNISDRARSLVEELAALKRTQGISVPGEETTNGGNLTKRRHHLSAKKKRSFWGSTRNMFRGEEGDQRFASISAQSVIPRWTSQRGTHPAARLLAGCLLITALLFVISRAGKFTFIQKWYDRPTQAKEAEDRE